MNEESNGQSTAVRKILALVLFGVLIYFDTALWSQARESLGVSLENGGWIGLATNGESLLFIAGIFFELALAGTILWGLILTQADTPTSGELDTAHIFIFVLLTIAAIITEILAFLGGAPAGPPGWVFVLLVLLMSVAVIYGTAIWLWTRAWIGIRRKICSVVIPLIASWVIILYDTIEACLSWSVRKFSECAAWGTKTSRQCAQWGTRTSTSCRSWGTSTTRTCMSWLPAVLGFICLLWNVVVQVVCLAWQVIVTVVCLLWLIIVELVCLLFIIFMILACLVWTIIVLIISLVLMVVIGLLRIFFFC